MNSIMTLVVYKYGAMWAFDDKARGLEREPFIAGMDDLVEAVAEGIPYASLGFNLTFSATSFPGHQYILERGALDSGGVWYYSPHFGIRGWLCPAFFKFFCKAPKSIYISAKEIKR